jgi:apolipoprotein D and lipocalin family protein
MKACRPARALALSALLAWSVATPAQTAPPLQALPAIDVPGYMGTWYQIALFPNRFQKQCVSDTTATYRQVEGGIEVTNRCRMADGRFDSVTGFARPSGARLDGDQLVPARLEVSFLPWWLRWLPIWGGYWVVVRAEDGRYVVVSEPKREYLWVLARQPTLAPADEVAIRSRLGELGVDLARWQGHPQPAAASSATPAPPSQPQLPHPPTTPAAPPR